MTFLIKKWTVPIARRLTLSRLDRAEGAAPQSTPPSAPATQKETVE